MKSIISLMVVLAVTAMAMMAFAEEPAKPAEPAKPLIQLSAGSAKIVGEPMVKEFPAMKAATAMEKASSYTPEGGYTMDEKGLQKAYGSMMDGGFSKLMNWVHSTGTFPTGPAFALYYEDPTMTEPAKLTAKVAFPVSGDAKGNENVMIEDIPAMTALTLSYEGSYEEGNNAWTTAMDWVKANGYEWVGPPMEVYLKGPMDVKDSKQFLTEIRIPVKKAEVKAAEGGTPAK